MGNKRKKKKNTAQTKYKTEGVVVVNAKVSVTSTSGLNISLLVVGVRVGIFLPT